MTLKFASVNHQLRNVEWVVNERKNFIEQITSSTKEEFNRIIWVDEHGFKLWTVRHQARSQRGTPAAVTVPTIKGKNISCILGVSIAFGKIAFSVCYKDMYPNIVKVSENTTNSVIFEEFLNLLLNNWKENQNVPNHIKNKGPIILHDNWNVHNCVSNFPGISHIWMPHYSPFLNVAEFINRDHKLGIRKLFRYFKSFPRYLEDIKWGEKGRTTISHAKKCAFMAWNDLPESFIKKHWDHIKETYFEKCLLLQEINC